MHKTTISIFNLVKDLEKKQGQSIPNAEIAKRTNLSRSAVVALMNGTTSRIEVTTIDRLLDFFHEQGMPVQVGELFVVERGE